MGPGFGYLLLLPVLLLPWSARPQQQQHTVKRPVVVHFFAVLCAAVVGLQVLDGARHVTRLLGSLDAVVNTHLWSQLEEAGADASTRRLLQKLGQQDMPPKVCHVKCSGSGIHPDPFPFIGSSCKHIGLSLGYG